MLYGKMFDCTFDYLDMDRIILRIKVLKDQVSYISYTNDIVDNPFVNKSRVTVNDVLHLLESRCFPRERVNARELIKAGGLSFYEPYAIVRKTHGIQMEDTYWIRFAGEELKWEDVKHLRNRV